VRLEDYDVLVFTAIENLEHEALHTNLESVGAYKRKSTDCEDDLGVTRWLLPKADEEKPLEILTKCFEGAGNALAALEAGKLLFSQPRPKLVVFCGIGGSLKPSEAQLGNVFVSDSFHWKGFDKISAQKSDDAPDRIMREKHYPPYTVDKVLLNHLKKYARDVQNGEQTSCFGCMPTDGPDFIRGLLEWQSQVATHGGDMLTDTADFDPTYYNGAKIPKI
jgi:hypothetical protein